MRLRATVLPALLAVVLAACSDSDAPVTERTSTTTSSPSSTASTASTVPSTTAPVATTQATTTRAPVSGSAASCPPVPARAEPRSTRTRYTLRVDVRPAENTVDGDVTARFIPDLPTDRLVFRLWANAPRIARGGGRIDVGAVLVNGARPDYAVMENPTTLVLRTGATFAAGEVVEATVPWRITLPGAIDDRVSRTGDAIRLGSFFPILPWEPGVGWALQPATSAFAESSLAPAADFDVRITVPAGFDVLATGTPDGAGRWTATAVNDIAISVGDFTVAQSIIRVPHAVTVAVGVHSGIAESPQTYLDRAIRALADFSSRFGPYPWPAYTLAITPHLQGGIEYPMHVMQGPATVGRTTSHEVGHMWFYGLVANDQGRDPWIDEGLATFAEARFEGSLASMRARSIPVAGRGKTAEPMTYWESRQSIYYRSVYVQGAQALAALGPPDLVDCALRYYVATNAYRVARPVDVVAAARAVFGEPGVATLARYGIRP